MAYRVSNGWRAEWRVGYGRNAPRRSKVFATKRAAEAHEERQREAQRRGEYVDPTDARTAFRDVAEQLLDTVEDPSTKAVYESRLRLHVLPVIGDVPIGQVSEAHVDQVAKSILRKGLAESTRHGVLVMLAMVLRHAQRRRIAPRPPHVPLPEPRRRELVVLTKEQAGRLLEKTAPRGRAVVAVGLGCGVRIGEALGLTVPRVEFLRKRIRVEEQLDPRRPGERKPPKTAASQRTLPMPRWVSDAVAEHLAMWPSDDVVFRSQRGHQWRASTFTRAIWKPALEAAGLPATYGFHVCRHFYVATLVDLGRQPLEIQRLLGHKSITETMGTYGHLFPHAEDTTRSALDGLWDAPGTHEEEADGL